MGKLVPADKGPSGQSTGRGRHGNGVCLLQPRPRRRNISELKITHLIPKGRVGKDYIVRFAEGVTISNTLLRYKWQHIAQSPLNMRNLLSVLKTILLYRGPNQKETRVGSGPRQSEQNVKADLRKHIGPTTAGTEKRRSAERRNTARDPAIGASLRTRCGARNSSPCFSTM